MIKFSQSLARTVRICTVLATFLGCDGTPNEQATSPEASIDESANDGPKVDRDGWPTETEAIATILKVERAIRASESNREIWHITDLRHEVHSVHFADRTVQKWMEAGSEDVTTYPARISYTRVTEYSDQPDTVEECGTDGTWWFYRDPFGEWAAKYGVD